MGLLQRAVETYDCFSHLAGTYEEGRIPLAPISHIITSAEIEITLNQMGKYLNAKPVEKEDAKTIIPVTEDSVGRTSAPCAHPLCDQLSYLAPYDSKRHSLYLEQLEDWKNFDPGNKVLQAVWNYVGSGTILKDLAAEGLIKLGGDGKPEKEKMMVRWRVEDGEKESACWKNKDLFQSFIRYYEEKRRRDKKEFCMVSGELEPGAKQHLKGIVPKYGNAKLISSNDTSGFTYRGRFAEDWQASSVSYAASQKAHNALYWLVANQGVCVAMPGAEKTEPEKGTYTVYGGRTFLCWNPQGQYVPPAPFPLLKKKEAIAKPTDYKRELKETLSGYSKGLPEDAQAVMAVFDAATTGRLSVTYYNEWLLTDFLERLKFWDETCYWENGKFGIQSPALYWIVRFSYGTLREENIAEPADGIMRQQMQRLVMCRLEQRKMPRDIKQNLVEKASKLELYDKYTRISLLLALS